MSRRKRVHEGTEVDTPKTSTTPIFKVQRDLAVDYSKRKSISNQDIPLSSIYYRLFEILENHKVPCYTISSYQQISMLSPQTPRNKRRCLLGLDLMKDQVQDTPMRSSCLTSLPKDLHKKSFKSIKSKASHTRRNSRAVLKDITNIAHLHKTNSHSPSKSGGDASTHSMDEDDEIVGNDLFGGIIDTDHQQVFDCSSLENTDTEDDESDLDDSMDSEADVVQNNVQKKHHDSTEPGGVLGLS
ncbi:hypothetical protein Bca52824_016821 [Brassica carinata]|uniref:Uncharacterized protein n=1 Tax=Brassica carinata TaxID=52824 RepID=A0A8X7W7T7_BRACI|nr:hypothetical protein Bca52824_016821 [Brassica carinata]